MELEVTGIERAFVKSGEHTALHKLQHISPTASQLGQFHMRSRHSSQMLTTRPLGMGVSVMLPCDLLTAHLAVRAGLQWVSTTRLQDQVHQCKCLARRRPDLSPDLNLLKAGTAAIMVWESEYRQGTQIRLLTIVQLQVLGSVLL